MKSREKLLSNTYTTRHVSTQTQNVYFIFTLNASRFLTLYQSTMPKRDRKSSPLLTSEIDRGEDQLHDLAAFTSEYTTVDRWALRYGEWKHSYPYKESIPGRPARQQALQ
jgi:hypothetical protein